MAAKLTRTSAIKNVTVYGAYLILIWGFYRFLFQFPEGVEELVIKPILWLLPLIYIIRKEGNGFSSLGFTFKNFFPAIYFSIGLGIIFVIEALLANYTKYSGFNFGANVGTSPLFVALGFSFATAFSEETAFRGYIFSRLSFAFKNEFMANIVQTILWVAIHVPIAFFIWKLGLSAGILYLILTAVVGFGSAFVFARTGNIIGPIFLHVLWEWPIILFR